MDCNDQQNMVKHVCAEDKTPPITEKLEKALAMVTSRFSKLRLQTRRRAAQTCSALCY